MKSTKIKSGTRIEITFLDHVEDGDEPIEFVVDGIVKQDKAKAITVAVWYYSDRKFRNDTNEKVFTIVKSTITNLKTLH